MSEFYSYELYKDRLQPLKDNWKVIRDEGLTFGPRMSRIRDPRSDGGTWLYSPLEPEREDLAGLEAQSAFCKKIAPITVQLCSEIKDIKGYAFSLVTPGGHIFPHTHDNKYVTCSLGLQAQPESYMLCNGKRKDFKEGEFVIFDYRISHEIFNNSKVDRLNLLVLLPLLDDG